VPRQLANEDIHFLMTSEAVDADSKKRGYSADMLDISGRLY
jgi:hypothetical protein